VTKDLSLRSRQRTRKISLRHLRQIVLNCLEELLHLKEFELGVQIVAAREITGINERYLQHAGVTDVITFDYQEGPSKSSIHGDIFVCIDEALEQAKQFGTSWQSELVRYIVHGILHLVGYDDRTPPLQRKMKRVEENLVAELTRRFPPAAVEKRRRRHG
jgi:probable rRNA maturation factor